MTITSDIVASAYRESNLIMGGASPTPTEAADALVRLNSLVAAVLGNGVGAEVFDWPVGQEGITALDETTWDATEWAYPPANVRLIAASDEAQTIYFLPQPNDGARMLLIDPGSRLTAAPLTVDGNGRTVEGAATQTISTDGESKTWLYRADLGDWKLLSVLTDADEFPFPIEFDDYFITSLAARINPRYGRALSDLSIEALTTSLSRLRARYRQPMIEVCDPALVRTASVYGGGHFMTSQNGDRGSVFNRRVIRPPHYQGS